MQIEIRVTVKRYLDSPPVLASPGAAVKSGVMVNEFAPRLDFRERQGRVFDQYAGALRR